MSFVEQFELAREMGFPCPTKPAEAILHEARWISKWEAEYAKL